MTASLDHASPGVLAEMLKELPASEAAFDEQQGRFHAYLLATGGYHDDVHRLYIRATAPVVWDPGGWRHPCFWLSCSLKDGVQWHRHREERAVAASL